MKYYDIPHDLTAGDVAPFAGAWIEIFVMEWEDGFQRVAPFAGAWIEIFVIFFVSHSLNRRSLRGSVD